MLPLILKAKETYPNAKERFIEGLPKNESFFIVTRLRDKFGKIEQVFVAVKEIRNGIIYGNIWSTIGLVSGYKFGDKYTLPETDIIDWLISKPDGTEEGNIIGKFLDEYQKQ